MRALVYNLWASARRFIAPFVSLIHRERTLPMPMTVEISGKRTIAEKGRLFEPLNNFLIILSAISYSTSVLVGGTTHKIPKPVLRVTTRWSDFGLAIPLGGPLQFALRNKKPQNIEIGIITSSALLARPLPDAKLQTAGFHAVIAAAIEPTFLQFFERYNEWLTATLGDATNWPPTLNFARVVRNAVAHGKINFRSPNSPVVRWKDLSYGPADNGKQIIGTDMKMGEILALMFECDDALDAIGAPVL